MHSNKGFLRHFHACNRHDLSKFVPFYIGAKSYGWVAQEPATFLMKETNFFQTHKNGIALAPHFDDFAKRSEALATAARKIAAHYGRGLRKEMYPVIENWGDEPLAELDRAAVPWFGVRGFGVHVNGFVRRADGIHLWVGERAMDRLVDPGKLDNMIGGGQPIGLTIEENLRKEAKEEAGMPASLADTAKQVSTLHYLIERQNGLRNDFLFIFDIELPADFIPRNTDGEVAAFHLMPLAEVASIVRDTDRFKFNCNLVIIDFLVRHGFVGPEHAEYAEIVKQICHPGQASLQAST
jgi:8-oxo-dGTP pyrophosphatase MutT (NUDIX family)